MNVNVGGTERTVRIVVGVILVVIGAAGYTGYLPVAFGPFPQVLTSVVIALVGVVLLVTSSIQFCPLNSVFGRNSARR